MRKPAKPSTPPKPQKLDVTQLGKLLVDRATTEKPGKAVSQPSKKWPLALNGPGDGDGDPSGGPVHGGGPPAKPTKASKRAGSGRGKT